MNNNEKYELLGKGETGLASVMGIYPSDKNFQFNAAHIEKALADNKDFKLASFNKAEVDSEISIMSFNAEIEYKKTAFNVELYVCSTKNLNLRDYGFANSIDEESLHKAMEQEYYLEVSMYFELEPLTSFHLQLKILNAIVPHASLVIDHMSYRLLSAKWLSMTAKSSIPPSPDYLYVLHCVYDEEGKDGNRRYWFHTHGLHRCGSVELEMLNFSQGAEQMQTMINMTVKKFLSHPALEKERFTIGYDGMGINLCWLRWEEALKDLPQNILGGASDRDEADNVHAEPSGILFAVEDGNMISPEIYAPTLAENPIYYINNEETARMSALAKESFAAFEKVFRKEHKEPEKKSFFKKMFAGKDEEEQDKWTFLVKLGLTVDNAEAETEKEHLWFDVQAITDNKITGKLLNQPYWISGLNEGDVKEYPVDVLTDWLIYSPDNTYSPDSIYQLVD
ncbi:uncharacterized protein YegJ (DUF2314 family) [Dysgonomonas sp. PFB1-18]|uniref:DUF4026 domain-containing protein n=1 Tax=unclassified Dysgonomonas TaxID=2630389 RepID=UPI002476D412|nr:MULTISPECIES: DUF4026 domain-containing protein [unclassified Dysgonomonas]MDH6308978.1 uncharacterized protein YegJ (DUF2314 family) [Dysgonomonas sp. PF1-14]MDH6338729.1 uncharacterized protein YegJ (DUF2314 family) [Dysgonomonas sp. PF1-16]MDH6380243.1 uncharacterized protein YegJ (DUF2314 family) [Dysgonomonas sp. PFB1-18]MDH6397573.1 uncharacterized protein YegJ (DUF2314 family) [Dysgonomonas sp. PF1-23]